jgi:hypothetical protein
MSLSIRVIGRSGECEGELAKSDLRDSVQKRPEVMETRIFPDVSEDFQPNLEPF